MTPRRGLLWAHTAIQLAFGVVGFAFFPGQLFADADDNVLAALSLRLAASSNASQAALVAILLWLRRDVTVERVIAGALALYHVLASIDAARLAAGWLPVTMTDGRPSPIGMHLVLALVLGIAAAWPVSAPPPDPR